LKARVMTVKPPPGVECTEDAHLLIWRPRGVLNESQVNKILAFIADQERKLGRSFNRFTDMSALDAVDLSFKYVFHVALYRRLSRAGRQALKSAFFATNPKIARSIKLHALLTDHSPLQVSIFTELGAAAKWLGVSIEILTPPK
jgi:hypothetical protein